MPVFFICFIVFIIWFRVKMKRSNSSVSEENEAFWEREKQANFARTRDISTLDYLTVADTKLPFSASDASLDEREADLEQQV